MQDEGRNLKMEESLRNDYPDFKSNDIEKNERLESY
jgi:hypothetical protein